ncbi:hypothetical protein TNCV_2860011 [Trichonephila clavipes]|nr:hypothetical protein TNCV_2860011 [Trichonephila clavipes]
MRVRAYYDHSSIRDHWVLRCMSTCVPINQSEARPPVLSPSKFGTHLSAHCNRDVKAESILASPGIELGPVV